LAAVLLSIRVSFILVHGSVFIIALWVGGGGEFDEFVVMVLLVVELLPDLFDCGEVFLVSGIGFGLLRYKPVISC
jgi:hypothetical protein